MMRITMHQPDFVSDGEVNERKLKSRAEQLTLGLPDELAHLVHGCAQLGI